MCSLPFLFASQTANAQSDEEMKILRMFYKEEDLIVSATRNPKPLSQVAENITVVTSGEIEEMNAHTLADVLNTVPGVQMDIRGGPGSAATAHIEGSEFRHVLVTIDGVTLNNLSDSFADIGAIPVQDIERIEIIKGPASSSWGSSLGGVINIITKSADDSRKIGGTLSASYGEENTGDYRAEASGRIGPFGYYLNAGNLVSNGLRPNTSFYENNLYAKLQWDMTEKASLLFTFGYDKGSRGEGEDPVFDRSFRAAFEYLFSTLSFNYSLSDEAALNFSLRTSRQNTIQFLNQLSTGEELGTNPAHDLTYGGSARFTLKKGIHDIVVGTDYDNGELRLNSIAGERQVLEKWALYANDTISMGSFTFTPGLRYDHTNTNGDFFSPSLGVTYKLDEKTILRGYIARGFSIPPLSSTFRSGFFSVPNPDLKMEKVWSMQAGVESAALKYFWVKTTLFRHDIDDAIVNKALPDNTFISVNEGKQRRQGVEFELRTVPVYNTSFSAGFAFIDARDRNTGEKIPNTPGYTYDIGVYYDDNKSIKASLRGHYIWWNADQSFDGDYNAFVWDFNVSKKVKITDKRDVELFLTAHNIFNGSQYLMGSFKNPRRWVEGGVRLKL